MLLGFAAIASLWLATGPPLSTTADLDGDGVVETATIAGSGARRRLEIYAAGGALLAHAAFPGSPASTIELRTGSLASAGALLEVVASDARSECRSLWRFRDRGLTRLPVTTPAGPLHDCAGREWSYRWEQPNPDAPAVYVRERARATEGGLHRQIEVFRFRGFELSLDPTLSSAQIRGVFIPLWGGSRLYSKVDLDALYSRFDLSRMKRSPRLTIAAEREEGVFELRFYGPGAGERSVPICAAARGADGNEVVLTGEGEGRTVRARVTMAGNGAIPVEASVDGAGEPFDRVYTPVLTRGDHALQVFPSAEDELAVRGIAGNWSTDSGVGVAVLLVSAFPAQLRFGASDVRLSIDDAPEGIDALLVPEDGSAPTVGLVLLGPDRIARVPVKCAAGKAGFLCRPQGSGEGLRRVGSRLNKP